MYRRQALAVRLFLLTITAIVTHALVAGVINSPRWRLVASPTAAERNTIPRDRRCA
jgi:hypothetical protein